MEKNIHWLGDPNTIDTLNETKHGEGRATTTRKMSSSMLRDQKRYAWLVNQIGHAAPMKHLGAIQHI